MRDDREARGGAEGGGREEPRRGDQLPQEDQPAAQGAARGNHLAEEVDRADHGKNCVSGCVNSQPRTEPWITQTRAK